MRLYGYRTKSLITGLGSDLDCTSALYVTTALLRRHTRQL